MVERAEQAKEEAEAEARRDTEKVLAQSSEKPSLWNPVDVRAPHLEEWLTAGSVHPHAAPGRTKDDGELALAPAGAEIELVTHEGSGGP